MLTDVSFTLLEGHTKIMLGASGSGKCTILKILLGLLKPDAGVVWVNGHRVDELTEERDDAASATDIGMVFQEGALFDSLTVRGERRLQAVRADATCRSTRCAARVEEVLGFVGLAEYIDRMPSELSGGQRRRVAIARAMATKPRLLLYDEPTTGLDPITATTVDDEIIKLRDLENVSSIMVTHQLRDAFYVATHTARREDGRIGIVPGRRGEGARGRVHHAADGRVVFEGDADELRARRTTTYLQTFLS